MWRCHRALLLASVLLLSACTESVPAPAAPASFAPPPPLGDQPPVAGLPHDTPRLAPVLAELRANPEWLDEPIDDAPEVLALVPGVEELCLALRGSESDVIVTIDPGLPWSVSSVALDRGDSGREITFDPEGLGNDICAFVLGGRTLPWPADPAAVEVIGSVAGDEARAIAAAVHASPERFGIDAHGVPSVNVGDRIEPGPGDWACSWAYVYVGGPRSTVVVGTRRAAGGWEVDVRIVDVALRDAEPRRAGRC